MSRFVNLTGYTVRIPRNVDDGSVISFQASKDYDVAVENSMVQTNKAIVIDGIQLPVLSREFNLPSPEDDTIFIVPEVVAKNAIGRNDLAYPENGEIRNETAMSATGLVYVTSDPKYLSE